MQHTECAVSWHIVRKACKSKWAISSFNCIKTGISAIWVKYQVAFMVKTTHEAQIEASTQMQKPTVP